MAPRSRAARPCVAVGLIALVLAALAAGCGEKEEGGPHGTDPVALTLDFYPNADHAGIYLAQREGFFRDAGLSVEISQPSDPAAPIKQVAAGRSDLAISYAPEVLIARDQGLDVVAVAALVDQPLTSMIWLADSGIGGVSDLRGRTVATAGIPYQEGYLQTITERAGLPSDSVEAVNVGLGLLPALLGGRADAILGAYRNVEGVDLRLRGKRPVITPVDRLGVPSYDELVLVADEDLVASEPEKLRLFMAALERGTAAAVADPRAATDALLAASPGLDPILTQAEVEATVPLLAKEKGRPYGRLDAGRWDTFIAWMRDNGLIEALPAAEEAITNELLPGRAPAG